MKHLDGSLLPEEPWRLELKRANDSVSAVGPLGNELTLDRTGVVKGRHYGSEEYYRFLKEFLEAAGDDFVWRWPEKPSIVVIRSEEIRGLGEERWAAAYDLATLVESPGSWYCSDFSDPQSSVLTHQATHAYFRAVPAPELDFLSEARRVSEKYRAMAEESIPGDRSRSIEVYLTIQGLLERLGAAEALAIESSVR